MMKILGASNVSSGAKFNLPYRTDLSCTQAILSAELHNTSISISSVRFLQALFLKLRPKYRNTRYLPKTIKLVQYRNPKWPVFWHLGI